MIVLFHYIVANPHTQLIASHLILWLKLFDFSHNEIELADFRVTQTYFDNFPIAFSSRDDKASEAKGYPISFFGMAICYPNGLHNRM